MNTSRSWCWHLRELYGNRKPFLAVVVDNVCDQGLELYKQPSSLKMAPEEVATLWNIGHRIDGRVFQNQVRPAVAGDDVTLDTAGIPTVPVSGVEAAGQSGNTCSAQSMEAVAEALVNYVLQITPPSAAAP